MSIIILIAELEEEEVSLLSLWTSRDYWMKFDILGTRMCSFEKKMLDEIGFNSQTKLIPSQQHCMLECFIFTIKEIHDWDFTTAPQTLHHHSQPPQHICIAFHQKYHHLFHFHHLSRADWSHLGNVEEKKN